MFEIGSGTPHIYNELSIWMKYVFKNPPNQLMLNEREYELWLYTQFCLLDGYTYNLNIPSKY